MPSQQRDEYLARFRYLSRSATEFPTAQEVQRRLAICKDCEFYAVDGENIGRCKFKRCENPGGARIVFTCPLAKHRCPRDRWIPRGAVMPLVSVCMASREEGAEITATVRSALDSATGPIEIIVCDDASTDGSCDDVAAIDPKRVTLFRNERPRGAGWSMDRCMKAASGEVIFKIDAHMRFEQGLFHGLAMVALKENAIVCAVTKGLNEGEKSKLRGGATISFADWAFRPYEIALDWQPPPTDGKIERRLAVMGACYGMPRTVWEIMGEYPSTVGIWGAEEQAMAAWAWLHDVPILVVPGWEAKHLYRFKQPIPWGGPSVSMRALNVLVNLLRLFEWETYAGVWRTKNALELDTFDKLRLAQCEIEERKKPHVWKRGRKRTDAEFFRDVMHMPAVATEAGAVERIRPISVILAVRNEGDEVLKTVCSFVNQAQSRFEMVVVDDASVDGSVGPDFVARVKGHVKGQWRQDIEKRIKVIRHETPIGSSASRAEGIRAASGEIYSIWDGHQRMNTLHGIEKLATTAQALGGIVIPAVRNMGNPIDGKHTYGAKFQLKGEPWGILNKHLETPPADTVERRQAIIGCGYTFTRETLEALGDWPELPGVWAYQEQWLGFRAYFLDIPCWIRGDVKTEHKYKKEFNYVCTRQDSHGNGHFCLAVHFPETYETFWKLRLPKDIYLADCGAEREKWLAFRRPKNEKDFFRECLGIETWPPTA